MCLQRNESMKDGGSIFAENQGEEEIFKIKE